MVFDEFGSQFDPEQTPEGWFDHDLPVADSVVVIVVQRLLALIGVGV